MKNEKGLARKIGFPNSVKGRREVNSHELAHHEFKLIMKMTIMKRTQAG